MQYPVFEPGMHCPRITIPNIMLGCPPIEYYYLKTMGIDQSKSKSPLVKKIRALLGGGDSFKKDKRCPTADDLVQQMEYLYVRVVKAQGIALFGRFELFGEVNVGYFKGITKTASMSNPKWDQVFAFSRDCIKSATTVEIFVKERYQEKYIGRIWFDLSEVPNRVPTDSRLEPQRYKMEGDNRGDKAKSGELMLSIWFGTQADEAFSEAWHSTAANVPYGLHSLLKSQIYFSPKLWCLRVLIIEAQDIMPGHRGSDVVRFPEFSAKVQLGDKRLRTKNAAPSATRSFSNPYWNEELFFAVAEPFENDLLVLVEDQVEPLGGMAVARVLLPVATIEKRADEKLVNSKWFDLDSDFGNAGDVKNKPITRFVSRIHLRVFFDGRYSLVDEDTVNNSTTTDVSPSDKRLVKPPHIGVLEIGILGASGLWPVKCHGGGETDAYYCVAYYGGKWVRTRTVVDNNISVSPKWNEQYVWEVYDPCTVVTIAVFQNNRITKNNPHNNDAICDYYCGKVRIRLSTLENDRVYCNSYPLLIFDSSGLNKMGDLQLAVRFSCTNVANMLYKYTTPKLPKMHCVHPLSVNELSMLRHEAVNMVASKLSRVEPPLDEGVVKYTLCHDSSQTWSMRKSKAAYFRITHVFSSLVPMLWWLEKIRTWQKPVYSALFLIIFLGLVMLPEFTTPAAIFFYLGILVLQNYRCRPQHPPCFDTRLSHADCVHPDDLDEEFDTIPTTCPFDVVRWRYDRLRSISGRLQTVVEDIATMFEKFQALLSWKDPRATFFFVMFCLVAAVGFYNVPFRVVLALWGLYLLRPPWLRSQLPSPALAFFGRLPCRVDCLIYGTMGVGFENQEVEGLLMTNMVENFQQCIKLFV